MTQHEHTLVAGIIVFILHQMMWHMYFKHQPITKKNIRELYDIFKDYF